jgi:hypothetical protein
MVRRERTLRIPACALALVLLALFAQRHHHARLEGTGCVACVVRVLRATPSEPPAQIAPPVLLAEGILVDEPRQPGSPAVPTPRAQGPPQA